MLFLEIEIWETLGEYQSKLHFDRIAVSVLFVIVFKSSYVGSRCGFFTALYNSSILLQSY